MKIVSALLIVGLLASVGCMKSEQKTETAPATTEQAAPAEQPAAPAEQAPAEQAPAEQH